MACVHYGNVLQKALKIKINRLLLCVNRLYNSDMKTPSLYRISGVSWHRLGVGGWRPLPHLMAPGQDDGSQVYKDFDLWVGVRGRCTVEMLGRTFEMGAGTMIMVPPCVTTRKFTGPEDELLMWFVHFSCFVKWRHIDDGSSYVDPSELSLSLPDLQTIALVSEQCPAGLNDKLHSIRNMPDDDLRELTLNMTLMKAFRHLRAVYVNRADEVIESRLERATRFMGYNLYRPLLSDEIAQHVHVSRKTLERLFQVRCGMGPMQYLTHLRLELACEMLRGYRRSIFEIAHACGYSSVQYFSRAFSKEFNMSPSAYRNRHAPEPNS